MQYSYFYFLKTKKHICYLSYDGIVDPLGQSQILPYLYSLNKNINFNFTIISFEKAKNINKIPSIKIKLNDLNIKWVALKYTKNPPIISTLLDIVKLKFAVKKLLFKKPIDLLHCRSYITAIAGLTFKNNKNIPFVFDMRGFYADERVDGKIWNKKNLIYNFIYEFFKEKEKQFLTKSNHTVSLTFAGKKEIESWGLPNLSPISIIPCCTDEKLFNINSTQDRRKDLGIKKSEVIITYVGSIGTWYLLKEMLEFFKVLYTKTKKAKFLFITKDDPLPIFKKCREISIPKAAIIIKSSEREGIPSLINVSNFSIFFITPKFSKIASSPTKMGEIMNLGIPIICNTGVGDVEKIMNECMPELLVNELNKKEYNRIINLILNNYKFDQQKILKTSVKYYSLTNGIKKYTDIYTQILN